MFEKLKKSCNSLLNRAKKLRRGGEDEVNNKKHGIGYYLCPPRHVKFLLWILLAGLVSFSLIRITLLIRNMEQLDAGIAATKWDVAYALFTGVRFDIVLAFYLIAPSLLLLGISQFMGKHAKWMNYASTTLLSIGFSLSLMCNIGDIPFFEYTNTHVDAVGIRYANDDPGQALSVITNDRSYLIFACIAIVVSILFTALIIMLARHYRTSVPAERKAHAAIYLLLLIAITPLSARGLNPIQSSPMTIKDSIISYNNFVNQLSINPVIPFVESLANLNNKGITLMDSDKARAYVIEEYNRDENFNEHVEAHESPWRNVVIILQEGNCAVHLAHEGSTKGLLPNLDRLIKEGRYYENTFSTSTHTSYGIYSTVTSMPPYMHLHPLEDGYRQNLHSPFDQVQQSGKMSTLFFITHEPEFDNVGGFIPLQGFGKFVSLPDYGINTTKSWGVDDHMMFDRALQEMDAEYAKGKPFAAVCLTCSNHRPYDPPTVEGFTTTYPDDIESHTIQYADWAMNRFIEMCKEKPWFDETLFIITADHGRGVRRDFIVPESCLHIPLLFYSPKHIKPEVRTDLVSQMDIVPTAMSMLGIEYDNHSFGIDLTTQKRRMVPSSSVTHMIVRDYNWLYISDPAHSMDYLYDLNAEGDTHYINVVEEHRDIASGMDEYIRATIQAGWDMHNTPMGKQ